MKDHPQPTTFGSVHDYFVHAAGRFAERPFLNVLAETAEIYGIDAGEITYGAMAERVEERKRAYAAAGYGPGCRAGLLLENRPVFFEHWLALNGLGQSSEACITLGEVTLRFPSSEASIEAQAARASMGCS